MIKKIKLKGFRLFKDETSFDVYNDLVIFSGKNAKGKTSILEAINLISTSKSQRTNDLIDLINNKSDYSLVEIIDDEKKYRFVISKEGKSFYINNNEIKKVSDFIGNLKVVLFSLNDLSIINGSKAFRRRFLDQEISLIDKDYLKALMAYKKLLKERNDYLKSKNVDVIYLDVITKELIKYLTIIYEKRISFIDKLNNHLSIISKQMNIESIKLTYIKTYKNDILESFKNNYENDIKDHITSIGTHRDDFKITINDLDASIYASDGQIRTIAILLKLAVKEIIKDITNVEAIILLDDVYAALDNLRISKLTSYVLNNSQTFITTTTTLEVPDEILKKALVISL